MHDKARAEAVGLFERGLGYKAVSSMLGVPRTAVRKWEYAWRATGGEALMTSHKKYSHDTKLRAVRMVVDEGVSKPETMERLGIRSLTALDSWARAYREGGADALLPKRRGRPRKPDKPEYASREEELEARVRELELELEIQKRINALADGRRPR